MASLWALCASSTIVPPDFVIHLTDRKEKLVRFDLDFGDFEIRGVQASLDARFESLRLPASVSKSGLSRPEIDFADPALRHRVLQGLIALVAGRAPAPSKQGFGLAPAPERALRLTWLEPSPPRSRWHLAKGEIWLGGMVAVKFSLMKSQWTGESKSWWIAYPAEWVAHDRRWSDLVVIKDRKLKKRIAEFARQTYLERYAKESDD